MSTIALLTIEQAVTLMAFDGAEGSTSAQIAQRTAYSPNRITVAMIVARTAYSQNRTRDLLQELRRLGLVAMGNPLATGYPYWHLTMAGRSRRRLLYLMIQGVARE